MPGPDPHWTAIFQALLTPAIGLCVAWIAFMQWWTNHQKFRLDLFDRRYAIYDSAKRLIASVLTAGQRCAVPTCVQAPRRSSGAPAAFWRESGCQPAGVRCSSGWKRALYAIFGLPAIQ
jgi:hypothetical protein